MVYSEGVCDMKLIEMDHVEMRYPKKSGSVTALSDVTFSVEQGEMVGIIGRSGAGKSSLTYLLGCLASPTGGQYRFAGKNVAALSAQSRAVLRSRAIGFVFQDFHLLPALTALENVEMPLVYNGVPSAQRRRRAYAMLSAVGLSHRLHHRPFELSGGQQQRVAIARALVTRPKLLLADEPTGNLDSRSSADVMKLLTRWNALGNTVILVTHDSQIAAALPRTVRLHDGKIVSS